MRSRFDEQLALLNKKMIEMGSLCERIVSLVAEALVEGKADSRKTVMEIGHEIDQMERDIESICLKLLLQQQPVARDLRQISAALKMITDMERIGDQAEDIAEIITYLDGKRIDEFLDIRTMEEAINTMVTTSIDAYVEQNLDKAKAVEEQDDIVDECFDRIKTGLINLIAEGAVDGELALDILMIAKYFERIGDHAVNIAEWVEFSVTGEHKGE